VTLDAYAALRSYQTAMVIRRATGRSLDGSLGLPRPRRREQPHAVQIHSRCDGRDGGKVHGVIPTHHPDSPQSR
jgi:hypothetical protein